MLQPRVTQATGGHKPGFNDMYSGNGALVWVGLCGCNYVIDAIDGRSRINAGVADCPASGVLLNSPCDRRIIGTDCRGGKTPLAASLDAYGVRGDCHGNAHGSECGRSRPLDPRSAAAPGSQRREEENNAGDCRICDIE